MSTAGLRRPTTSAYAAVAAAIAGSDDASSEQESSEQARITHSPPAGQRLEETVEDRIRGEVERQTVEASAVTEQYKLAESILGGDRWFDNVEGLAAVRLVMALGLTSSYGRLQQLRQQIGHAAEGFDEALAVMDLPDVAQLDALHKHLWKGGG